MKTPHHHGNLREALIVAGMELLQEGGTSGLTLRKCAARAGVSHAAPAHHFKSLDGLLSAIAARGYEQFAKTMMAERDKSPDGARDQLLAICQGYLDFAEKNEALFDLIFNSVEITFDDPDLDNASTLAYQILAQACAPFVKKDQDPRYVETKVWSLVHGFACLSRQARGGGGGHPACGIAFADVFDSLSF